MPKDKKFFLFLFLFLLSVGCHRYECCKVLRGAQIDFPVAPKEKVAQIEMPVKPVENITSEKMPQETEISKPRMIEEGNPFPSEIKPEEKKISMQLTLQSEPKGRLGSPHLVKASIVNQGKKIVETYQLKITLPDGLNFEDQPEKSIKVSDFSNLKPDETHTEEWKIVANREGKYTVKGELLHTGEVKHTNNLDLVFEPNAELSLILDGPLQVNLESQFEYNITVINKGQIALTGILVQHTLETGLIYITSTPEGSYQSDKSRISWKIGDLLPREQKVLKVKVTASKRGEVSCEARAKDEKNLARNSMKIKTEVVAAIALQIQLFDTNDPVEVGEKTIYVVEVSNQKNKEVSNIQIVNTIPAETSFVTAQVEGSNAVNYTVAGQRIQFDTIKMLAPKEKVTLKITVKVEQVGDLLNTVEVRSDEFEKPISKQEATKSFKK
ncbi:MAG: DUF11 domain-containing protein [Candidatus Brocadiae bacterium]|nr:DUF11 domain-containing protein [Candidatus Brocadiia bacterium]